MENKTDEDIQRRELQEATDRLNLAKSKILLAENEALQQAADKLAKYKAQQEEELHKKALWAEAVANRWAEQKQREADEELAKQRGIQAEQAALEQAYNRLEDEKRQKAEHEAKLRKLDDEMRTAELTARRIAEENARQATRQLEHEIEFADAATAPAVYDGLERTQGGMSPHLARLFQRSAAQNAEPAPILPNIEPLPMVNVAAQRLIDEFGEPAYLASVEFVKNSPVPPPGVTEAAEIERHIRSVSTPLPVKQ